MFSKDLSLVNCYIHTTARCVYVHYNVPAALKNNLYLTCFKKWGSMMFDLPKICLYQITWWRAGTATVPSHLVFWMTALASRAASARCCSSRSRQPWGSPGRSPLRSQWKIPCPLLSVAGINTFNFLDAEFNYSFLFIYFLMAPCQCSCFDASIPGGPFVFATGGSGWQPSPSEL